MVIPASIEVYELMKKVPAGKLITINAIRFALATKRNATIGVHEPLAYSLGYLQTSLKSKNGKGSLKSLLIGSH